MEERAEALQRDEMDTLTHWRSLWSEEQTGMKASELEPEPDTSRRDIPRDDENSQVRPSNELLADRSSDQESNISNTVKNERADKTYEKERD